MNNGLCATNSFELAVAQRPLAYLNEYCHKNQISPQFEFIEEGPVHKRIYHCKITIKYQDELWMQHGSGGNKKAAKSEAAKSLLLQFRNRNRKYDICEEVKSCPRPQMVVDPLPTGEPVERLSALAQKMGKPLPVYDLIDEVGNAQERVFITRCTFDEEYDDIGRAWTKKGSKRVAAHKVLLQLSKVLEMKLDECKMQEVVTRMCKVSIEGKKLPRVKDITIREALTTIQIKLGAHWSALVVIMSFLFQK